MKVTRVEIEFPNSGHPELLAYVTVELDQCFVVHSMRLINGTKGWFVAMPSKKWGDRCAQCSAYNAFDAKYCEQCGVKYHNRPLPLEEMGVRKYQDIAHPLTGEFRDELQEAVFTAYKQVLAAAK